MATKKPRALKLEIPHFVCSRDMRRIIAEGALKTVESKIRPIDSALADQAFNDIIESISDDPDGIDELEERKREYDNDLRVYANTVAKYVLMQVSIKQPREVYMRDCKVDCVPLECVSAIDEAIRLNLAQIGDPQHPGHNARFMYISQPAPRQRKYATKEERVAAQRAQQREWFKQHQPQIRERRAAWYRNKFNSDPAFRAAEAARNSEYRARKAREAAIADNPATIDQLAVEKRRLANMRAEATRATNREIRALMMIDIDSADNSTQ